MQNSQKLTCLSNVVELHIGCTQVLIYDIDYYIKDRDNSFLEEITNLLPPSDIERANRFLQRPDRVRSILSRYFLRINLAEQIGCIAHEVAFSYGDKGKPYINLPGVSAPHFNISHSGRYLTIAISSLIVGVDIEEIKYINSLEEIVQKHFSSIDHEWFTDLPEKIKTPSFYHLWTSKEALAKATGNGIIEPLSSLIPFHCTDKIGDWAIRPILAPIGYAATLAWENKD